VRCRKLTTDGIEKEKILKMLVVRDDAQVWGWDPDNILLVTPGVTPGSFGVASISQPSREMGIHQ
jgi:hypothetical protein